MIRRSLAFVVLALILTFAGQPAQAQQHISFRGAIFSDYSYQVESPDEDEVGENAFGYRRARLTADFKLSDQFDGRIRFESTDDEVTSKGKPAPYIKDLYLRWKNVFADGHMITFGMFRPPIWWAAEDQWGYRSLEKTIQDRVGVASSRDIGIGLTGPVNSSGSLTYAAAFGNNSGGRQETDKYKRVYGQLTWQATDNLQLTAGSDYYGFEGGSTLGLNSFVGYTMEKVRLGAEGFISNRSFDEESGTDERMGLSLFANADVGEKKVAVLRFDRVNRDNLGVELHENWATAGLAFVLDDRLQVIPNVIYVTTDADDQASILARLTVWATF